MATSHGAASDLLCVRLSLWRRSLQANRAHTYLGKRESEWHQSGDEEDIYPNFVGMARSFGVPAARVIKKEELRQAIRTMLDTSGPYLLEVRVPRATFVLNSLLPAQPLPHAENAAEVTHAPASLLASCNCGQAAKDSF